MSDNLEEHIQINVSVAAGGAPREGYGVGLIVSHNAAWPERTRSYNGSDALAVDWPDDSPERRAGEAMFAQEPRPVSILVGRSTVSVTQRYEVGAASSTDGQDYVVRVEGQDFDPITLTHTAQTGVGVTKSSKSSINTGLLALLNAVADKTFTATFAPLVYADKVFTAANASEIFTAAAHGLLTGDGPFQVSNGGGALPVGLAALTDYWAIKIDANTFYLATTLAHANAGTFLAITGDGTGVQTLADTADTKRPSDSLIVTANTAGAWFSVAPSSSLLMNVETTHTVSGLGDDLTEILNADSSWYCLLLLYPSTDYVSDAAAWVEANDRVMVFDENATEALNTIVADGDDTLAAMFGFGYSRTMGAYHHAPHEFMSAAWMGRWLPTTPGKATTKYKQLVGITKSNLSPTQSANLRARRANAFQRVGRVPITWEGTVPSLVYKFFDVRRNADWVRDTLQVELFNLELANDIIDYTPEDIQKIGGTIHGVFDLAVRQKVFSPTPAPTVTLPVFETISTTDKSDRVLRDVGGKATFGGAIHKIIADINLSF